MPLGLITGIGRAMRRKRTSSLDILSSKRAPRGYVVVPEKLPNYVVPDLTGFKLKPYVSQCQKEVKTTEVSESAK
ncbi:39S ribosomal protein [Salix suchowensis]|nr:39S ribosomal protein [Salix suchowensis]